MGRDKPRLEPMGLGTPWPAEFWTPWPAVFRSTAENIRQSTVPGSVHLPSAVLGPPPECKRGSTSRVGRRCGVADSTRMAAIRSFLFAPGNDVRKARKALSQGGADAVILDLEDAVAISEKPAARQCVVDAFSARPNSSTRQNRAASTHCSAASDRSLP